MKKTFLLSIILCISYNTSFAAIAASCDIQLALYKADKDYYLAQNTIGCDADDIKEIKRQSIVVQGEDDAVVIATSLRKDEHYFKSLMTDNNYYYRIYKRTLSALVNSEPAIERSAFFIHKNVLSKVPDRYKYKYHDRYASLRTRFVEDSYQKFDVVYAESLALLNRVGLRNQAGTGFLDADYFSIEPISSIKARALINIYSEGEYTLTRQIFYK
jgi:hypothetical protein